MGRVSRQQAEEHRQRIVETAARLFRERGPDAVGVAEIMTAAGLTHGGFYGHFASKDVLAAEACGLAFDESRARWTRRISSSVSRHAALTKIVEAYLGKAHRDAAGPLCAAAAFAGAADRQAGKPIRDSYAAGFESLVSELAVLFSDETGDGRAGALAAFATMAGALMLARATRGEPVSDEILQAARGALLER